MEISESILYRESRGNTLMNMEIVILEDSQQDYLALATLLKRWEHATGNHVNIIWNKNETEILDSFHHRKIDIIFSDVELNEQIVGFDICKKLRQDGYHGEIIFLTSHKEYVFQGYDVQALNYLIKPITNHKLSPCLKKYVTLHTSTFCCIHSGNDLIRFPYHSIISVRKDHHDAIIQTEDQLYYERTTLAEIEKKLPPYFLRCHKSCIINIMHVNSIIGNTLFLSNKETQTIGRNFLPTIRKAFLESSETSVSS